jgi:hypothetical protein
MALIDLYNSINTTLTADQAPGSFYDDLGGRIWLIDGPADDSLPHAIIVPITDDSTKYFDSTEEDVEFVFQINVYSKQSTTTPEALIATNDKLILLLDGVAATVGGGWQCGQYKSDEQSSRGTLLRDGDAWVINSQWILTASQ